MKTVNDLMVWLNQQFGLKLPTSASFARWPMLQALWNLNIFGGFPSGSPPPPWSIRVQGSWPLIRGMDPATDIVIEIKDRQQFMEEQGKAMQFGKIDPDAPGGLKSS